MREVPLFADNNRVSIELPSASVYKGPIENNGI